MSGVRRFHRSRRLAITLGAAWILGSASVAMRHEGMTVLSILIASIVGVALRQRDASKLRASFEAPAAAQTESAPFRVGLRLFNLGRRPVLAEWEFVLPSAAEIGAESNVGNELVPGHADFSRQLEMALPLFGRHSIGPLHLRTRDAFGFTAEEFVEGDAAQVRVYPRRERIGKAWLPAKQFRTLVGPFEISRPGEGMEFFGLRDYAVGDRPRDINWKASARTNGALVVNQRQRENDAEFLILTDTRGATLVGRQKTSPFVRNCRATLAIAQVVLKVRSAVRIHIYGGDSQEQPGPTRSGEQILERFLDVRAGGSRGVGEAVEAVLPRLKPRTPIVVCSALVGDESMEPTLQNLLARGFPIQAVCPAADFEESASPSQVAWHAEQLLKARRIRRMGIPVARLQPNQPVQSAIESLAIQRMVGRR